MADELKTTSQRARAVPSQPAADGTVATAVATPSPETLRARSVDAHDREPEKLGAMSPGQVSTTAPALAPKRPQRRPAAPRARDAAAAPSPKAASPATTAREVADKLRTGGLALHEGPASLVAPGATLTRALALDEVASVVFMVPRAEVHALMLETLRAANPNLVEPGIDPSRTKLAAGTSLSLAGAPAVTRIQLDGVSAALAPLREAARSGPKGSRQAGEATRNLELAQAFHARLGASLRVHELVRELARVDTLARSLATGSKDAALVRAAYEPLLAQLGAAVHEAHSSNRAQLTNLAREARFLAAEALATAAERRVELFSERAARSEIPSAERRSVERELRGALAAAVRHLVEARAIGAPREPGLDAKIGRLRAEANRLAAQLYVQSADDDGVLASYRGTSALPPHATEWITQGGGLGRGASEAPPRAVVEALTAMQPEPREQALAELEHLGNQLVATHRRGVRDDAARIANLQRTAGERLGRSDVIVQSRLLDARRLAARGDHEDAAHLLDELRRAPPGQPNERRGFAERATIELAATLNAWALSSIGKERQQATDRLHALRVSLAAQSPPALSTEQTARLLLMEANALLQANRSRDALHTLSNLQHPDYAELDWVRSSLDEFRRASSQGDAKAAWTVFASELNAESLGEALAWTGGGAAAGAAVGAAAGVWFLGVGALVGAGVGALVGSATATAGLKAANVYNGWDRVMQARTTGVSAHSTGDALLNGAFALVDVAGVLAPLRGAQVLGRAGGALLAREGSDAGRALLAESMRSIEARAGQLGGRATTKQLETLAREELLRRFGRETAAFGGVAMTGIALGPLAYQLATVLAMPSGPERERAASELYSAAGGMLALMAVFAGGTQLALRGGGVKVAHRTEAGKTVTIGAKELDARAPLAVPEQKTATRIERKPSKAFGPRERGPRPDVVLSEWTDGARRFSLMDGGVLRTDSGETFKVLVRVGETRALRDAAGKPYMLIAGDSGGRARLIEATEGYSTAEPGTVSSHLAQIGVQDGQFYTVLVQSGLAFDERGRPAGLAKPWLGDFDGPLLTTRFTPNDPYVRDMVDAAHAAAPTTSHVPVRLDVDGQTYWHSDRGFLVDPSGRVRRRFATSTDGATSLYADAQGNAVALRGNPREQWSLAALEDGRVEGSFARRRPPGAQPAEDARAPIRHIRVRELETPDAPPPARNAPEANGGSASQTPIEPLDLWVVGGRLFEVAERGGALIGFDRSGRPVATLARSIDGQLQPSGDALDTSRLAFVRGIGAKSETPFLVHRRSGAPIEFLEVAEATEAGFLVHREGDAWAIADLDASGHVVLRDGILEVPYVGPLDGSEPQIGPMRVAILEGKRYQLHGRVIDSSELAWGVTAGAERLLRVVGEGRTARVEPAGPQANARVVNSSGRLLRIFRGDDAYTVVAQPMTREQLAAKIAVGVLGRTMPDLIAGASPITPRHRPVYEALSRALIDKDGARPKIHPDVDDPLERLKLLDAELIAGDGPFLRHALGDDANQLIEAAAGYSPATETPFIYAVRAAPGLTTPMTLDSNWQFAGLRFDVADFGIFVEHRGKLRAATIAEVRRHFDRTVGNPDVRAWKELPRAGSVDIEAAPPPEPGSAGARQAEQILAEAMAASNDPIKWMEAVQRAERLRVRELEHQTAGPELRVVITKDDERFDFAIGPRPASLPAEHFPSDAQLLAWLREIPIQALREVQRIEFTPAQTPGALGSFNFREGVVAFHAVSAGWALPENQVTAAHEIAGHGIEMIDPLLYRMLFETALLDAQAGTHHAPRTYGEKLPAEYFATLIEDYVERGGAFARARPNAHRLFSAIFNDDGARTRPDLYRRMAQGMLPLLLAAVVQQGVAVSEPGAEVPID